jgi:phosphatidylinositol alpha-1,6-mannosyltransferase
LVGRILLFSQVFPPRTGGSGRWLWELYRRLPDVAVHVAAGAFPGAASFDQTADLPITRLPLDFASWGPGSPRSVVQYARGILALDRIVNETRPDTIHCGKCLPEGLLAVAIERWRGIPFCCYVHGEELMLARTSRELKYFTRMVLRRAAKVVANGQHTKRLLLEEWDVPDHQVAVMHPGVDTTRFVPADISADIRRRLGWVDRRVVLTVGALQQRKGQDMMIRALPAVRARCPEVLYVVVGEGWERSYLHDLVVEHDVADAVQFRGRLAEDQLVECYQQCDVFVLPNRQVGWDFEGFGIVLLEAQACGKPVIAGRSGGTAETLDPGVTGELVACDAPEELAGAVTALLIDAERARAMGARARQFVVDRFDWQVLGRRALEVFAGSH